MVKNLHPWFPSAARRRERTDFRSREALFVRAPELCGMPSQKLRRNPGLVRSSRPWTAAFITIGHGAQTKERTDGRKEERRRNAARRVVNGRTSGCGAAPALILPRSRGRKWERAARLTAFHRGTRGGEPTPPLSSRRTSWDAAKKRALPAPACPSPATVSQTGHGAGRA